MVEVGQGLLKTPDKTSTSARLDWVQGMRGIAALSVVLTHCSGLLIGSSYHEKVALVLAPFAAGVDLFFVISGFIMVYVTRADPGGVQSAVGFAFKRFQRIWPAYFILTVAAGFITFGWDLVAQDELRARLARSILFLPADYASIYGNQIIRQGWTLGFEVYFYLVFAVSLLFRSWRWTLLALWWGLTLIVIPLTFQSSLTDVFGSFKTSGYPFDYLKVMTSPLIWEFVGGGLAGLVYTSAVRINSKTIGLSLIVGAVNFAIWHALVSAPSPSLGIGWPLAAMIAIIAIASKTCEIRVSNALRYLGDISYTLYLEHLFVMFWIQRAWDYVGLKSDLQLLCSIPVAVMASIGAAALTSRLLERDVPAWTLLVLRRRRSSRGAHMLPAGNDANPLLHRGIADHRDMPGLMIGAVPAAVRQVSTRSRGNGRRENSRNVWRRLISS